MSLMFGFFDRVKTGNLPDRSPMATSLKLVKVLTVMLEKEPRIPHVISHRVAVVREFLEASINLPMEVAPLSIVALDAGTEVGLLEIPASISAHQHMGKSWLFRGHYALGVPQDWASRFRHNPVAYTGRFVWALSTAVDYLLLQSKEGEFERAEALESEFYGFVEEQNYRFQRTGPVKNALRRYPKGWASLDKKFAYNVDSAVNKMNEDTQHFEKE